MLEDADGNARIVNRVMHGLSVFRNVVIWNILVKSTLSSSISSAQYARVRALCRISKWLTGPLMTRILWEIEIFLRYLILIWAREGTLHYIRLLYEHTDLLYFQDMWHLCIVISPMCAFTFLDDTNGIIKRNVGDSWASYVEDQWPLRIL